MKKLATLAFVLLIGCLAAVVSAYPFGPLPQCGVTPNCADGCLIPANDKCAAVAADAINSGDAVACVDGLAIGTCTP